MKRAIILALILCHSAIADEATQGVVIYHPPGTSARLIPFSQIAWTSAAIGKLSLPAGGTQQFQNDNVEKIVYFSEAYWTGISINPNTRLFRAAILGGEIVLAGDRQTIASDDDAKVLDDSLSKVDQLDHQYPAITDLLALTRQGIADQIANYKQGEKKVGGQWLTADDFQKYTVKSAITKFAGLSPLYDEPSELADKFIPISDSTKPYPDLVPSLNDAAKSIFTQTASVKPAQTLAAYGKIADRLPGDVSVAILMGICNSPRCTFGIAQATTDELGKLDVSAHPEAQQIIDFIHGVDSAAAKLAASVRGAPSDQLWVPSDQDKSTAAQLSDTITAFTKGSDQDGLGNDSRRFLAWPVCIEVIMQVDQLIADGKWLEASDFIEKRASIKGADQSIDGVKLALAAWSQRAGFVHDRVSHFAQLIQAAQQEEAIHHNQLAIAKYQEADKVIHTQETLDKIKDLQDSALGL